MYYKYFFRHNFEIIWAGFVLIVHSEDGLNIPCRECRCPNTKGSGHSFADKCSLDQQSNPPEAVCKCQEEYKGKKLALISKFLNRRNFIIYI